VRGDGTVTTQPLAGTRALSVPPCRNAALCEELLNDPKEVYEHAVSVRGAQESCARSCVDGFGAGRGVHVGQPSGQRASTWLPGDRAAGRHAQQVARDGRAVPGVTVSGLPKPAACEAIHRYENEPRDLYGGAVVVAGADGSLDAALVLRTVFQRGERTWLRVGAGVVEQSTPEREFEETREKLRSISRFLVRGREAGAGGGRGGGSVTSPGARRDELTGMLAELVEEDPATVAASENLFELGLDSISLMQLVARWRRAGWRSTSPPTP